MKRPVKNFDFISLTTREYCFKYFWPVLALGTAGGFCLGCIFDDWLITKPVYEGWSTYLLSHGGIPGKAVAILLTVLIVNTLVYCLLHKITDGYLRRKKLTFLSLFETVKKEVAIIENKQKEHNAVILREYFIYTVAMKAGRDSDEIMAQTHQ